MRTPHRSKRGVLAWRRADDLTAAFAAGEDVYVKMASRIYGVESDVTKDQRFVGKTTILVLATAWVQSSSKRNSKTLGSTWTSTTRRVINIYRKHWKINKLWRDAQQALVELHSSRKISLGCGSVLELVPEETAIRLPSGLLLRYDDLKFDTTEHGVGYYKTRRGRNHLWRKGLGNVCQAIARCIIAKQMLKILKTVAYANNARLRCMLRTR